MLESIKVESNEWTPRWVGDDKCALFEVEKKPDRYTVNLAEKKCSCNIWDLTGIPCCHSVAAMAWCNHQPEDYVSTYYSRETYLKCYQHIIHPVNGPKLWPQSDVDPIQPPKLRRQPGRPKKMRKKGLDELPRDPSKLPRHHSKYKCAKCKQYGHNQRSCKGKAHADRELPVGSNKVVEPGITIRPDQHPPQPSQPVSTNSKHGGRKKIAKKVVQQVSDRSDKKHAFTKKERHYITRATLMAASEGSRSMLTDEVCTQQSNVG